MKIDITAEPGVPQVIISRSFDAPRELVYRAFIDPDLLVRWLGPRKYEMVIDHFDAREGGTWRYLHRGSEGEEYWFHGVFHGMTAPERMVQTFEFEGAPGHVSLDTATFEEVDGRTTVTLNSVFQSVAARDAMVGSGMASGVDEGFDRLEEVLGSLAPVA